MVVLRQFNKFFFLNGRKYNIEMFFFILWRAVKGLGGSKAARITEDEGKTPPFLLSIGQSGVLILTQLTVPVVWHKNRTAS